MRMLVHVKMPHKEFNDYVKDGTVSQKMKKIFEDIKPQAVYFTEYEGRRGAVIILDVPDSSLVPKIAEPWFLIFHADVEFHVAMTPDDLEKADLEKVAQKWI